LPSPEDLLEDGGREPRRDAVPEGPRAGFEDTTWFRINIGRRHNADPRWMLPLLCRRGHITKNEVGAIRIAANESAFEVPRAVAAKFAKAVARTAAQEDDGLLIEAMQGAPDARERPTLRREPAPPRHKAKPFRGGGARRT
jgi:ATP-dependent RNA helicase DeaD